MKETAATLITLIKGTENRYHKTKGRERNYIRSTLDAGKTCCSMYRNQADESVRILCLNARGKIVKREEIAKGKYLIMSSHQMATIEEFCTDLTILSRSKTVLQGNLAEIKKGYGRINLFIKAEQELRPQIEAAGVTVLSSVGFSYQCRVTGEEQANALLKSLVSEGITLIAFELREPSLHEIFVEKVGETHEES